MGTQGDSKFKAAPEDSLLDDEEVARNPVNLSALAVGWVIFLPMYIIWARSQVLTWVPWAVFGVTFVGTIVFGVRAVYHRMYVAKERFLPPRVHPTAAPIEHKAGRGRRDSVGHRAFDALATQKGEKVSALALRKRLEAEAAQRDKIVALKPKREEKEESEDEDEAHILALAGGGDSPPPKKPPLPRTRSGAGKALIARTLKSRAARAKGAALAAASSDKASLSEGKEVKGVAGGVADAKGGVGAGSGGAVGGHTGGSKSGGAALTVVVGESKAGPRRTESKIAMFNDGKAVPGTPATAVPDGISIHVDDSDPDPDASPKRFVRDEDGTPTGLSPRSDFYKQGERELGEEVGYEMHDDRQVKEQVGFTASAMDEHRRKTARNQKRISFCKHLCVEVVFLAISFSLCALFHSVSIVGAFGVLFNEEQDYMYRLALSVPGFAAPCAVAATQGLLVFLAAPYDRNDYPGQQISMFLLKGIVLATGLVGGFVGAITVVLGFLAGAMVETALWYTSTNSVDALVVLILLACAYCCCPTLCYCYFVRNPANRPKRWGEGKMEACCRCTCGLCPPLLDRGLDVANFIRTNFLKKYMTLPEALRNADEEMVLALLEKGTDPNKMRDGGTPLEHAVLGGSPACVQMVIAHGGELGLAKEQETHATEAHYLKEHAPFHMAIMRGDVDTVMVMLDAGESPNVRTRADKLTPLHIAVALGEAEIVDLLVSRPDTDLSLRDARDISVLEQANLFKDEFPAIHKTVLNAIESRIKRDQALLSHKPYE